MAWKYNNIIIRAGRSWTDNNGIKHPTNWMSWTDSEKEEAGLVWTDDVAPHDSRFYWGRNADGSLIPKSLTDVNEVDADGNPINDIEGNQIVTLGLKSVAIAAAKTQAASNLASYDWYVVRKAEKSTAIPSAVTTYRDSVRTACAAIETSINNASDLAAFMALYDTPFDSDGNQTGNAPIYDWPDAI